MGERTKTIGLEIFIGSRIPWSANAFREKIPQKIPQIMGYFLVPNYFTLSQMAVKAFGSLTASSARTLRSSSMPLVFIPLISLL